MCLFIMQVMPWILEEISVKLQEPAKPQTPAVQDANGRLEVQVVVAATGKPVEFWGMCILRIRDGQIVEAWNTFDFLNFYQQLGMVPQI